MKGIVPNCDLKWNNTFRAGNTFFKPLVKNFQKVKRVNSFHYTGTRLFNILPRNLRDSLDFTLDEWKSSLDKYLSKIPDNPHIDGLVPEPCDRISSGPCNSILSWARLLVITDRRTQDNRAYISI